ncbi:hypothetical protein RKD44_007763 [Streptomyces collinus]
MRPSPTGMAASALARRWIANVLVWSHKKRGSVPDQSSPELPDRVVRVLPLAAPTLTTHEPPARPAVSRRPTGRPVGLEPAAKGSTDHFRMSPAGRVHTCGSGWLRRSRRGRRGGTGSRRQADRRPVRAGRAPVCPAPGSVLGGDSAGTDRMLWDHLLAASAGLTEAPGERVGASSVEHAPPHRRGWLLHQLHPQWHRGRPTARHPGPPPRRGACRGPVSVGGAGGSGWWRGGVGRCFWVCVSGVWVCCGVWGGGGCVGCGGGSGWRACGRGLGASGSEVGGGCSGGVRGVRVGQVGGRWVVAPVWGLKGVPVSCSLVSHSRLPWVGLSASVGSLAGWGCRWSGCVRLVR